MANLGNTLGKMAGNAAGTALGAKIGAAIGTAGGPIGTLAGGALGTLAGSALGAVGDKLGGTLGDAADNALANSDWDDAEILRSIISEEDPEAAMAEFTDWPISELKDYIKNVHGYSPEEQDDIIKRVKTHTDVDNDGNVDLTTTDVNGDGDPESAEIKPGKGEKKASSIAKEALKEDTPLDDLDSTGTVTDNEDDDDPIGIIKETIKSYKY